MSDIPPPSQPGMYADAQGTHWYWDGATWTPAHDWGRVAAASGGQHSQERSHAVLSWVLYLVLGGWLAALVFYLISKDKPFTRHHAAEALNLTLALLIPQIAAVAMLAPAYLELLENIDEPGSTFEPTAVFFVGIALILLTTVANTVLAVVGAVKAHRGEWYRLPILVHPVRGVLRRGASPPYDVNG